MTESLTCRKCGENRTWNKTRREYNDCRNGCTSYTAAIPDGTERAYAAGSDDEGRPVRGDAIHRKPTCND